MTTPNQKSDARPISFILHNMAMETAPIERKLVIRPEDLSRNDQSRLTTTQTLGGAWADNFGGGIPTIQLSGHTGWGSGDLPNGLDEFQALHDMVYVQWHYQRAEALLQSRDPDMVKLIFADKLDDFIWVVAPQSFTLRRNKSRPLLSQYQINLTYLSDDVRETLDQLEDMNAMDTVDQTEEMASTEAMADVEVSALDSIINSIQKIADFIVSGISSVLGTIKGVFDKIVEITAKVLSAVQRVISAGMGIVGAVTSGLLGIAGSLCRAAANVTSIVHSVMSLPQQVKAQFQRVGSAFENAFCVISNVFKKRKFLPYFDSLYGASNCSSTAGGSPISRFDTENPFPVLFPVDSPAFKMSSSASAALGRLNTVDPVLYPQPISKLSADMYAVGTGIEILA
jgi:hypothetical protein